MDDKHYSTGAMGGSEHGMIHPPNNRLLLLNRKTSTPSIKTAIDGTLT
jgi:hypothetical protein